MARYSDFCRVLKQNPDAEHIQAFIEMYAGSSFEERHADWTKLFTQRQPLWQGTREYSVEERDSGLTEAVIIPHLLEAGRSFNQEQLKEIFSIELNRPEGDFIEHLPTRGKLVSACRKLPVQEQVGLFKWALETEPRMWVTLAMFQCLVAQIEGPARKLAREFADIGSFGEIHRHRDDPVQAPYVAALRGPINAVCELALEQASTRRTV